MLYDLKLDAGWESQLSLIQCCWPCFYTFMHTPLPQLPLAYKQFSWTDLELISERVTGILDSSFFLIAFFCEVLHYGEVSQAAGLNQVTELKTSGGSEGMPASTALCFIATKQVF